MAQSFSKLKDFVRSLALEKDANRKMLDVIKEFETLDRRFEQLKKETESQGAELSKANLRAESEAVARRELEKEKRRLEKQFFEYRQEAESETCRIIRVFEAQ